MKVFSPAFNNGQPIPMKFSRDGEDLSPKLIIAGTPKGTQSLALIMDDPDAPMGTFVHWVAWNLTPDTTTLDEGVSLSEEGLNDYGDIGYGGPCPPKGTKHRYFFKIYALDVVLDLPTASSKADLEAAMEVHILGRAEFIGTYQR